MFAMMAIAAQVARLISGSLAILLACTLTALPAFAEKRVALVLGNSAYAYTPVLKNPANDATDMAATLRELGFDVIEDRDLDMRGMQRVIRQFGIQIAGADVALFFYAGHGLQVAGQNHLVPTDAKLSSEGDVDFETLPLLLVLKQMEREAKTSLVLLDACRNNPLATNLARSMGTRAVTVGQGLAEVRTAVGTLIAFATQPGNVAYDVAERNSPYTAALLRNMGVPSRDIITALVAVRNDVLKSTGGKQVPWEHTSLTGQVYLAPAAVAPPAAVARPTVDYDKEMEITFWNAVKDAKSAALLQTYLERYPSGNFAGLAKVLVEQFERESGAARLAAEREVQARIADAATAAASAASKRADELRKIEEARRLQSITQAQAESRAEAERALAAQRLAEADSLAATKAAQDARREAAAARAEQQRLAMVAAEAEAARKAIVVAALPQGTSVPGDAKPADAPPDPAVLARALQTELKRVGCDPGAVDGVWGSQAKGALGEFARVAKMTLETDAPSQEALQALLGQTNRLCVPKCPAGEINMNGQCVPKAQPQPVVKASAGQAARPQDTRPKSNANGLLACATNKTEANCRNVSGKTCTRIWVGSGKPVINCN